MRKAPENADIARRAGRFGWRLPLGGGPAPVKRGAPRLRYHGPGLHRMRCIRQLRPGHRNFARSTLCSWPISRYAERMDGDRIARALARIDAALARASKPRPGSAG